MNETTNTGNRAMTVFIKELAEEFAFAATLCSSAQALNSTSPIPPNLDYPSYSALFLRRFRERLEYQESENPLYTIQPSLSRLEKAQLRTLHKAFDHLYEKLLP